MSRIGIVAALPGELAPLVRRYKLQLHGGGVWSGRIDLPGGAAVEVFAAAAGMGSAAATQAFSRVLSAGDLRVVLSYGWAGALSCGIKPPEVYAPGEVIDARTGERFHTCGSLPNTPSGLRLVTLDHVARAEEKRPLAERYRAVLVDMEAATVARLARARGIEFGCIKGISDGYTDVLPDFNRYLDARGQLRTSRFVASALVQPRYWAPLLRLGRHSKVAAEAMAEALPRWLEGSGLVS